ncbi:MAG: response regulator transcription factor [Bacteroidetes bacterium]|nr:response regulator transcription factor [Bacteroidota bacterium]
MKPLPLPWIEKTGFPIFKVNSPSKSVFLSDQKFNILVVEDDLLIAEMLKEMLQDLGYEVPFVARNFDEALQALNDFPNLDLCFLDINLEDVKNGFDVAEQVKSRSRLPIIFLTSYADKMTIGEAVKYQPEAYLVKPFSQTDLYATVEIVRGKKQVSGQSTQPPLVIKDGLLTVKVNRHDIFWIKSDNIYVELATAQKKYLVRSSLDKFLEQLDDVSFSRTHRSYAVNLQHVKAVNGQYLVVNSEKIPLSRKFRDEILERFKK